jgi:hypothetical protein
MIITNHQYLSKYPILPDSEKLIVGTIHPHNYERFQLPFFYGNVTSLWRILAEAFPNQLALPLTLEGVLNFLAQKKISISDTIIECERLKPTAFDQDLKPRLLNFAILNQIKNSCISEIYFTSGFGKNNAFKLFYVDILGLKITPKIKADREIILNDAIFGRPVKLIILYSPSGASNIGLSKTKLYLDNKNRYSQSSRPINDFKVDYYRNKFK